MKKLEELMKEPFLKFTKLMYLYQLEEKNIITLGRGDIISKNELSNNPGKYPVYSSSSMGDGEIGRYNKYMFDDERITWSIDGGGKFFYRYGLKYSVTNVCGWLKVNDESIITTKYLYYYLINEWGKKKYDYVHKAHPSIIRREYQIAIPPIEVQNEIVRILDNFKELEAELKAESKARKTQYEYYRELFYIFDESIPRKKIIDIANVSRGKRVTKKDLSEIDKYPVFQNSLPAMGYYNQFNYTANKTYIISAGAAGEIGFCKEDFWAADDCLVISEVDGITNKFIYYYLLSKQLYIKANVRKASIPRLSRTIIENIEIPLPPLGEQKRIVSILDRFDKLCNDISEGLPAEIEARRKQYEYYRDKLLNFKELKIENKE